MTSNDISNFLTSISEAKRAYEAEPRYQSQISELEKTNRDLQQTIADREIRIHNLKQFETELTAKLRSVEAERDDAGFRHLEEADKVQGLLTTMRQFVGDGLKIISAVEGRDQIVMNKADLEANDRTAVQQAKAIDTQAFRIAELEQELQRAQEEARKAQMDKVNPSPFGGDTHQDTSTGSSIGETKSSPLVEDTYGWRNEQVAETTGWPPKGDKRAADPIAAITDITTLNASSDGVRDTLAADTQGQTSSEGQSDGPFAETSHTTSSLDVPSTSVETETSASSNASQPERNRDRATFFKGRKYYDVTYYVPLHQWLNEGGTEEDYHWRPDATQFNQASRYSS